MANFVQDSPQRMKRLPQPKGYGLPKGQRWTGTEER